MSIRCIDPISITRNRITTYFSPFGKSTLSTPKTAVGYAAPTIWIHWLMLVLIATTCALMELKSLAPRGSAVRVNMALMHYFLGLLIFALAWPRLLGHITGNTPPITPTPPVWQATLAKATHGFLYVYLIALPVLGYLALSAAGKPVHLFFFDLPLLIEPDKALGKQLKDLHETGAAIGYFLIGMHAAAALYHHYKVRDDTLRRMLPKQLRA
jgi:cytochrome b561